MRFAIALVIGVVSAFGQMGQPVNVSISSPTTAYTSLLFYSGSDLQYICKAASQQNTATFIIGGSSPYELTSVVVLTNVGTVTTVSDNGLKVNDRITISGATVDSDLNATYKVATITNSKVFTIATVSVANATYVDVGMKFTTTAPRTTMPIWAIEKFTVAASLVTQIQWAVGSSGTSQICDNRAALSYQ